MIGGDERLNWEDNGWTVEENERLNKVKIEKRRRRRRRKDANDVV